MFEIAAHPARLDRMLASVVCALGLRAVGLTLPTRPAAVTHHAATRAAVRMADPADSEAAFDKARAMSVSEIKAELDLRGISYTGLFEKSELARALAESRSQGLADPEILDRFNREKMERMMDEDAGVVDIDLDTDGADTSLEDATAGDGSLPGGMKPEQLAELMQNPEMMALLSNPRLQEVMKQVMEKGQAGVDPSMMDPETRELLKKLQGILGPLGM